MTKAASPRERPFALDLKGNLCEDGEILLSVKTALTGLDAPPHVVWPLDCEALNDLHALGYKAGLEASLEERPQPRTATAVPLLNAVAEEVTHDATRADTLHVKISELPSAIRMAVRGLLRERRVERSDVEDLLREIGTCAARAVWSCQVQPTTLTPFKLSPTTRTNQTLPSRNLCCGNIGKRGENGHCFCSSCGQEILS